MRARKRFGQNFLRDRHTILRIIDAIRPQPNEHILEIGPGHGALTDELIRSGCQFEAIEIDLDLAAELRDRGVNVTQGDVLKIDLQHLLQDRPARVIGNLPYNISSPLLFRLFALDNCILDMHFMLQLEVVDRIVAAPGSHTYGRISVMAQYHCEAEKLFEVAPSAFVPRPKVTSAIIRLKPRNIDKPVNDLKHLGQLVTRAFSQRRKTIRNALKPYLTADQIEELSLDPKQRPETLSLADYVRCANASDPGIRVDLD